MSARVCVGGWAACLSCACVVFVLGSSVAHVRCYAAGKMWRDNRGEYERLVRKQAKDSLFATTVDDE